MSDPVITLTDIEYHALQSLGFCDMGGGWIARVQRGFSDDVKRNWKACGLKLDESYQHAPVDPIRLEHAYRENLAQQLKLGPDAGRFPRSEDTRTNIVLGSGGSWDIAKPILALLNKDRKQEREKTAAFLAAKREQEAEKARRQEVVRIKAQERQDKERQRLEQRDRYLDAALF